MADGSTIPNEGQVAADVEADFGRGETNRIQSVFTIADMAKPMMSVSQTCDQGLECMFKITHALVVNASCEELCSFDRQSGFYVTRPKLESLELVGRPSWPVSDPHRLSPYVPVRLSPYVPVQPNCTGGQSGRGKV